MKRFRRIEVDIDNLLLDPNNPRLIMGFNDQDQIPDNEIVEKQDGLLRQFDVNGKKREADGFFNTEDLFRGIKHLGFVPGNLIAVRKLQGENDKYVVVEGNRRISTAKHLLIKLRDDPEFELHPNVVKSLKTVRVKCVADGSGQAQSIDDILITRHGKQSQMPWKPYETAEWILDKYLNLSMTGEEYLHANEEAMTFQTFRYQNWRVVGAAERCSMTRKEVEDALKTVIVYLQIEDERKNEGIRPMDYSLIKALVINKSLMGGYFERERDTYRLTDSSCSKLEAICQFGERNNPEKILKDDKAVSRLAQLYQYTSNDSETLEKYANKYVQQVESGQLPLEKALALIKDREKSIIFIDLVEAHLQKRTMKADGELSYDKFSAEQADLLAYEDVKNTETLNWLEYYRPA